MLPKSEMQDILDLSANLEISLDEGEAGIGIDDEIAVSFLELAQVAMTGKPGAVFKYLNVGGVYCKTAAALMKTDLGSRAGSLLELDEGIQKNSADDSNDFVSAEEMKEIGASKKETEKAFEQSMSDPFDDDGDVFQVAKSAIEKMRYMAPAQIDKIELELQTLEQHPRLIQKQSKKVTHTSSEPPRPANYNASIMAIENKIPLSPVEQSMRSFEHLFEGDPTGHTYPGSPNNPNALQPSSGIASTVGTGLVQTQTNTQMKLTADSSEATKANILRGIFKTSQCWWFAYSSYRLLKRARDHAKEQNNS
jgi:hypothetical protein